MPNRTGGAGKAKTASTSANFTSHNASQEPSAEMMQAILERAAKRLLRTEEREKKIEELKNEGNKKFKDGLYREAVELYNEAIDEYGAKEILYSNLAAAYLKLEWYDEAEDAATVALQYEPKNIKARFRRGMARKGMGNLKAALADFETITMEDPSCREAAVQEEIIRQELLNEGDDDFDFDDEDSTDYDWPDYDEDAVNSSSDESDSSDCNHSGNGISCRFYNHEGCIKGTDCRFSHAPDEKSVRDKLGKNVCLYFLLDMCKFGASKCIYSHSKACLSHGWWDHEDFAEDARTFLKLAGGGDDTAMEDFVEFVEAMSRAHAGYRIQDPPAATAARSGPSHTRLAKEDKGKAKATEPMSSSSKPIVMLLALENDGMFSDHNNPLYDALRAKAKLVKVISAKDALLHLASSELSAVFVPDAGITKRQNATVLAKLVEFAKSGGSVVVGGSFSSFVRPTDLVTFFHKSWGLSWKGGSYHRTTFSLNKSHPLAKSNPSLLKSFSIKALHVKGITPDVAVYSPTEDSRLQSMVWAPEKITDLSESPVVHTRIGKGYFGYVGDVNGEEGSVKVTLAMLGLLDPPPVPPSTPTTQTKTTQKSGPVNGTKAEATGPSQGKNLPKAGPSGTKTTPGTTQGKTVPKAGTSNGAKTNVETQAKAVPKPLPTSKETNVGGHAVPPSVSRPKPKPLNPFILILSLENEDFFASIHKHLLSTMREKMEWKQALTAPTAMTMLTSPDLMGVFVTDPGIVRTKNAHVLAKLVEFVKGGGSAVVGGLFSTFTNMGDINTFFANAWGLRWKSGSYHRTTFVRNPAHDMVKKNPSLESAYSMKALHVGGVDPSHPVYLPTPEPSIRSIGIDPELITDHTESPAVQARIGKGYLGYVGDVNAEVESTNLVLAMLGLLDSPNEAEVVATSTVTGTTAPKVPPKKTSRPFMMVLSFDNQAFFTEIQGDLLSKLRSKLEVLQGLSNERVVDLLTSSDLVGILITDSAIADPENAYLLARLVEYTKAGGTVVIGGSFSGSMKFHSVSTFFGDAWGLPWKAGDYTRTEATLNGKHDFVKNHPSLPASFSVKTLNLSGIVPSMALYVASKQSHIYAPLKKVTQAPIVHAKVGEGYLGYLGDVGPDESHTTVVLAMFGLN